MNDHLFRVDWYEVGTRFRTVDRNSSDADKIFVRREHDIAIEGSDETRDFHLWEPCEVIQ